MKNFTYWLCEQLDMWVIILTLPIGLYLLYVGDTTNGLLCLILGEIWGKFEYNYKYTKEGK